MMNCSVQVVASAMGSSDLCASCHVTNSSCHLVSGLFTKPNLPPGYNLITILPQGSCSVSISFLNHNNNHFGNFSDIQEPPQIFFPQPLGLQTTSTSSTVLPCQEPTLEQEQNSSIVVEIQ